MPRTVDEVDEDLTRLRLELTIAEDALHEEYAQQLRKQIRLLRLERDLTVPAQRTILE